MAECNCSSIYNPGQRREGVNMEITREILIKSFDEEEPEEGRVAICCGKYYCSTVYMHWLEDKVAETLKELAEAVQKLKDAGVEV